MRRIDTFLYPSVVLLALLGLLIGMPTSTCGQSTPEKYLKAWNVYVDAQRRYQQALAEFFERHRPDLKDLIVLNRDLQLAMIDKRAFEFQYLLRARPERIVTGQDISRFTNFDWDDQDSDGLRQASPEFTHLEKRIKELRQRSDGHPRWPVLREALQSLASDPAYQDIDKRFQEQVTQVEKILAEPE